MVSRTFATTLPAILALALSACQPQTSAGDGANASDVRALSEPFSLREVVVGPAGEVEALRPVVPGDAIEVRLRTTGVAEDAELQIKLLALADGSLSGNETIVLDASSGAEHTVAFEHAVPREPGRYLIEVTLDGRLAAHQELEIHPEDTASVED